MSRCLRSAVLLLALHASTARAEDVYVWTDGEGETHYTNDIASIPERARRTARKLAAETPDPVSAPARRDDGAKDAKADGDTPKDAHAVADAQPPAPEPIETALVAPREDEKVTEDQWRSLFRKAGERLKRAERKAQRTREALSKLPGQDITTYDYAGNVVTESRYQSLRVQLDEDDYQLEQAREQMHDLERAAAREAVPLEWRR